MKKTFWLRELVRLLKGDRGDISKALELLQLDGHLTVHLVTQILCMFVTSAAVLLANRRLHCRILISFGTYESL